MSTTSRRSRICCCRETIAATIAALLLLIGVSAPAVALRPDTSAVSPRPSPDILDTIWHDTEALVIDGVMLLSAPLRFDAGDWGITGGVIAGTGLLMLADDPLRARFRAGHTATKDRMAEIGNALGTPLPGLTVAGTLYLGGLVFDAPGIRLAGRHAGQALLYAGLVTTTLKVVIGRQRPAFGDGPFKFVGPSSDDRYYALPSGHTTLAFALCSSLAADIDQPWATVMLYTLATGTALSRMYVDRHWASDNFLAAAIGIACGYGAVNLSDDGDDGSHSSLYILPTPTGLAALWRF